MITRLFIDNYRCFVNFELRPESLCLLVGDNGVGKSSVFDVVELLRDFIKGQISIKAFNSDTLTRWQSLLLQSFTMELRIKERQYVYDLVIEHEPQRSQRRVIRESLLLDGNPLYLAQLDNAQLKAQLFKDDYSKGPEISFDWTRSGIGFLQAGADNTYLCEFRDFVGRIMVVGILNPDPRLMVAVSDNESDALGRHGESFVSWYRAVALEYPAAVADLTQTLRDLFPGFSALALPESGDKRVLKAQFQPPEKTGKSRYDEFAFNELSDGQRCLIILYALLHVYREKPGVLLLDEPDNFISLREIQPWLALLEEICEETGTSAQALVASHNPELINYLGTGRALKIERPTGGAARVNVFKSVLRNHHWSIFPIIQWRTYTPFAPRVGYREKLFQHNPNHRDINHRFTGFRGALIVPTHASLPTDPGQGSFDHPTLPDHLEPGDFLRGFGIYVESLFQP